MKVKTADLTDDALNWVVAKIEGHQWRCPWMLEKEALAAWQRYECAWGNPTPDYSTDWARGGPIIERELITVASNGETAFTHQKWTAYRVDNLFNDDFAHENQNGPTPLIAAMRCFVASRLGDEVEIPDELLP
jgi:hypothetical protein